MTPDYLENILSDTYYLNEYFDLYIREPGQRFEYIYREEDLYMQFKSIKRHIKSVCGTTIEDELYDLETPYGYGGPVSNSNDNAFLLRGVREYKKHCQLQNIVSEFIRFHPFNSLSGNALLFDMHSFDRDTVVVDLACLSDERRKKYSKTTRNIVKKASGRLSVGSNNVPEKDFFELYCLTMEKNNAESFYYFDKEYFRQLKQLDSTYLNGVFLDGQLVAAGFFMLGKEIAHYHLSANNPDFAKENGNYLLLDYGFELAKNFGLRYMMLGGGRTALPGDNLLAFKKKFSKSVLPFHIGGLDFMPEKRSELNKIWLDNNPGVAKPHRFQLYRT